MVNASAGRFGTCPSACGSVSMTISDRRPTPEQWPWRQYLRLRTPLALVACLAATASIAAGDPGRVLAGRLTCTAEAVPQARNSGPRDLSCRLVRVSGTSATYSGVIKRYGAARFPKEHVVFTWSVLAPRRHVELETLEGRYLGRPRAAPGKEGDGTGGLVGGWNKSIVLQPVTGRGGTGASAHFAIVELELSATRI